MARENIKEYHMGAFINKYYEKMWDFKHLAILVDSTRHYYCYGLPAMFKRYTETFAQNCGYKLLHQSSKNQLISRARIAVTTSTDGTCNKTSPDGACATN